MLSVLALQVRSSQLTFTSRFLSKNILHENTCLVYLSPATVCVSSTQICCFWNSSCIVRCFAICLVIASLLTSGRRAILFLVVVEADVCYLRELHSADLITIEGREGLSRTTLGYIVSFRNRMDCEGS